jgi:hypothetical protein
MGGANAAGVIAGVAVKTITERALATPSLAGRARLQLLKVLLAFHARYTPLCAHLSLIRLIAERTPETKPSPVQWTARTLRQPTEPSPIQCAASTLRQQPTILAIGSRVAARQNRLPVKDHRRLDLTTVLFRVTSARGRYLSNEFHCIARARYIFMES